MNGKRFLLGPGAVLLCTSLMAYAAGPQRLTASAATAKAISPQTAAVTPEAAATTAVEGAMNLYLARSVGPITGPVNKDGGTTLGGSRDVPPNDNCEDAEVLTGPYPVTVCGTNVDATTDCPGSLDWEAVWYAVELPYADNNLVADYCASDFSLLSYQIGTIYLNDCSDCEGAVEGTYEIHDCGNGDRNAEVLWNEVPGPTTVLIPVYINPAHDFCIEFNVTEVLPPANDTCENAEAVTGPYPVTVCGTNLGATIDCPGVLDWKAVWYQVELPYEVNTVETDYCPSEADMSSDEIGIIYYNDCTDCEAYVPGSSQWYDCGGYRRNPTVTWRDVPGPGSILIPVYVNPAHDFCIEFNVRNGICELECPPDAVAEAEPCGEDTNGGCNMATPAFEPLTCGETVCGTGWADANMRDTDWYEITVDEPTTMTFTVEAEFITNVMAGLMEPQTPGVVGCDQMTGWVNPYATAKDCEQFSVVYNALPGTYWWVVAPDGWDGLPCGGSHNDYIATMTCEPWEIRGACCDDDTGVCTDNVLLQDCVSPLRYARDTACADIRPPCGGCPESTLEIEIRTDWYPTETTWTVTDHDTGELICSGGPYEDSFTTYFEYCCIGTDDCVDFTIYDLSGDGQWGPQGYAVRLDGVEMCSTIDTGWVGFQHSCNNIGRSCAGGRCCYAPWPNCTNTTLFDCISTYGGLWNEGLTCEDDPCQDPDAPDFEVVAPYTSPQRTTCGALDRCQPADQYARTAEHVYRVTIPYDGVWSFNTCQTQDTTDVTWLAVGTSMCSEDIGWNSWACNGYFAEVIDYLTAGDYYVDVEGNSDCCTYVLDVHEVQVCDPGCPEGSTPESEPCGEATNNGCWGDPVAFEPITANETICGTIYADNWQTDYDWFEYVATQDDTMAFAVRANFPGTVSVVQQYVPGVPGCDNITGAMNPTAQLSDCQEASVSFPVMAGGTYYMMIGHQFSYNSPCGTTNDYVATLTGSSSICGDLNCDGAANAFDIDPFVLALTDPAGYAAAYPDCDRMRADVNGDGAVNAFDIDPFVQCLTSGGTPRP